MERNYDEVIAEMLIELEKLDSKLDTDIKRLELTIRRMVKVETRLETFDEKLEQSIKHWRESHAEFLKKLKRSEVRAERSEKLLLHVIRKNNLKL